MMRKRELIDSLKLWSRSNYYANNIYVKVKQVKKGIPKSESNIRKVKPIIDDNARLRFNLVLPTVQASRIFGGISTAIKIFNLLNCDNNADMRIIVFGNEVYNSYLSYKFDDLEYNNDVHGIIFLEKEANSLTVRKNDVFVLTSWDTAYSFGRVYLWQKEHYKTEHNKLLYLIQDFEPGFYPWSAEYVLADSTYKTNNDDMIAIFNSRELYTFFKDRNYNFGKEYVFEPVLNSTLKYKLMDSKEKENIRTKRILLYGRQNIPRNLLGILLDSIRLWSEKYDKADEWEVISLGEVLSTIKFGNVSVISKGKLSLVDYADMMLSSYAAISLMASPHPSYPPLELSTFGVRTITNKFENKDLALFNDNIISIDVPTPENISSTLCSVCDDYYKGFNSHCIRDGKYVNGEGIEMMVEEIRDTIELD